MRKKTACQNLNSDMRKACQNPHLGAKKTCQNPHPVKISILPMGKILRGALKIWLLIFTFRFTILQILFPRSMRQTSSWSHSSSSIRKIMKITYKLHRKPTETNNIHMSWRTIKILNQFYLFPQFKNNS